jgi:hypothetical protein
MEIRIRNKIFLRVCCAFLILGLFLEVKTANFRDFDFLADRRFDNYVLDHGLLWESQTLTSLMCAFRCASFKVCISFHFNLHKKLCRGYETLMLAREAGVYEYNWNYFYLTDIGK